MEHNSDILLRVENLRQYFKLGRSYIKAVDDISFEIKRGEVFGLVGESGCGKTTTGRSIIKLYHPTGGKIYFKGQRISSSKAGAPTLLKIEREKLHSDVEALQKQMREDIAKKPEGEAGIRAAYEQKIAQRRARFKSFSDALQADIGLSEEELKNANRIYRERQREEIRARYAQGSLEYEEEMKLLKKDTVMSKIQMIFQDPIASLNPRMTVREIIAEGLIIRGVRDRKYIDEKVNEVLDMVGLVSEHADRYPHEFSGGQRQRIGVARAIVLKPELLIADEPISALDVSIQAQVINLLNDLRHQMGLTILFIAHDLSVVKYFSDRIAVMYYGKIVEYAESDELFLHPLHPYTKSLLSAIPQPDPHYEKHRQRLTYVPSRVHDYSEEEPTLREIKQGHFIHCNTAEFEQYQKALQ